MKIGYAKNSTLKKDLEWQVGKLSDEGCELIFQENAETKWQRNPQLQKCLERLTVGDTLVVCSLSQLGQSVNDVVRLLSVLQGKGVFFHSITDKMTTRGISGLVIGNMLNAMSKLEKASSHSRNESKRTESFANTKAGRKPGSLNRSNIGKPQICKQLYENGSSITQIKSLLNIRSYSTIYRYLKEAGAYPMPAKDAANSKQLSSKELNKLKHEAYDKSHQLSLFDY